MRYIFVIFTITAISFLHQFLNAKHNMDSIKKLNSEFNSWILNAKNQRPSNAKFAQLYKIRYGTDSAITKIYKENAAVIASIPVDLVETFPTTQPKLIPDQLLVLDNLEDYYTLKYKEIFSLRYWVDFIIFLPKNILSYLGLPETGTISRTANLLYWLYTLVRTVFENQITQWIQSIFFK
ncbi:hypothetical protein ACF3NG_06980 [Aerococcaceae bacterium WGS1372]